MTTTEIIIVLAVAVFASLTKSITGMGYPLIMIPAVALFMDVSDAVVLVAPINLLLNAKLVWALQEERKRATTLPRFLMGGAVGATIGTLLLPLLSDRVLRILLIAIVVVFLINRLRSQSPNIDRVLAERISVPVGAVAGFFQGAAGISGPVVTPWFLSLDLRRETFIFCVSAAFGLTGIVQLILVTIQGLFTRELLTVSAMLVPIALLVFPLGERVRPHIKVEVFERLILAMLAGSAASLLIKIL